MTNATSNYEDVKMKSAQIGFQSPAVYQLIPKREMLGNIKRMIFGEKDLDKPNKTVLLVGETGAGKSTLINTLFNYRMGVKFEDNIWFQIVQDEKRSQSESQTSDVIVYEIFEFKDKTLPYSLTIIDTPGYGSTRGIEQDIKVSQRLFDLFRSKDGVHKINAVGLVLKASENRLSDRLRYIFDSVMCLFGKDLEKNTVALITHSNGKRPKNVLQAFEAAKMKCAKNEKDQPVYFLFDNCQDEDRKEDREDHSYTVTINGMREFTEYLGITTTQKLKRTLTVEKTRIKLTACIQNLQKQISLIKQNQKEIQQTQDTLSKLEQEMKRNEKFTEEVEVVYKEKESISGGMWFLVFYEGALCCTVCEETCHYPCTIAWYRADCKVVKDGHCTVCPKKCPKDYHVKENWRYVTKTRKVKQTQQEMKENYEKNKAESEKMETFLMDLKKKTEALKAERDQLLEESYRHVVRLEQIAQDVNSLSTCVHLDFLIEKMKEKGDTEKVQKLEEVAARVGGGTRAAMRCMSGKEAEGGKGDKAEII